MLSQYEIQKHEEDLVAHYLSTAAITFKVATDKWWYIYESDGDGYGDGYDSFDAADKAMRDEIDAEANE